MTKPFFTIILLDSGDSGLLQKSLLLIKEQITPSWELILSPSAAVDPAIVDRFRIDNAAHTLRIIPHTSNTMPQRLNICINEACGDYIVFLRTCDVWNGMHLEVLLQHAKLYTDYACFIVRAILHQQSSSEHSSTIPKSIHHPADIASCYTVQDMLHASFPKLSQIALRRSAWLEQQGFDETFPTFFFEKLCIDIFTPLNIHIIDAFTVYIYEHLEEQWHSTKRLEKEKLDAYCAYTFRCFAGPQQQGGGCCSHLPALGAPCQPTQADYCAQSTLARPAKNCLQLFFRAKHSPYFDAQWYADRYGIRLVSPFVHYCVRGWKRGYDPSPLFSTARYLEAYPDVRFAKVNPLLHYIQSGLYEGRKL